MLQTVIDVNNLQTYLYLASGVVKAVDGVSFSIDSGKTLGIVGESGSGKSMTASSIIRLLPRNKGKIVNGEINFNGKNVLSLNKKELLNFRGKEVAVIFQDPMSALDPVFKIGKQMIEMICAHQDVSKEEARNMAIDALRKVGIPNPESRIDSYPYELSGGMCQRVIIAMAICKKPKLVIADEPTTALDVTVQAQVLKLLKEMQNKSNTAILLITHNLGVVWEMCDSVMVMYAGKTVEYTTTVDLYSEPLHPYTWGLLESIPRLSDDNKSKLTAIPGTPPDLRITGQCCNFYNRCPYVTSVCKQEVPPLIEVKNGHFVACHRQSMIDKLIKGRVENHD